jgi:hypothetical protein
VNIPLVDLAAQHAEVSDDVRVGLDDVFATTAFVDGPAVGGFETAYGSFVGAGHCIGVAPVEMAAAVNEPDEAAGRG